jgi:hypothetical protein
MSRAWSNEENPMKIDNDCRAGNCHAVVNLAGYTLLLLIFALFSISVCAAQNPATLPEHEHNKTAEPLDSTLTWEELANLDIEVETPAPLQTIFHVSFPQTLRERDGKTVQIRGFMYPLKAGETHDYFLLSALPPSCPFCLPGGQSTLIEVNCAQAVEYTLEPILLQGRFSLLEDDPSGLYYHIDDARAVAE